MLLSVYKHVSTNLTKWYSRPVTFSLGNRTVYYTGGLSYDDSVNATIVIEWNKIQRSSVRPIDYYRWFFI